MTIITRVYNCVTYIVGRTFLYNNGCTTLSCITIIFVANKRVQDVIGTVIVGLHRNSSLQCNCIKQWALHTHLDNRRVTYHYHFQYTIKTRRPASADRTARRQFQATGQPVSRTQASDAMTSRLPRLRRSVCNAVASNGGRFLRVQISRERSYPLPIY